MRETKIIQNYYRQAVLAFESNPSLIRKLRASCLLNGFCSEYEEMSTIKVIETALSNTTNEEVKFMSSWFTTSGLSNSGISTMFQIPPTESLRSRDTITTYKMMTTTLDSWLETHGLLKQHSLAQITAKVSVLKLDCEGCEPSVLLGATSNSAGRRR